MKKTILITGSTDGIGKLTAVQLAKAGHTICLHGRNANKLNAAIAEIKDSTNNENIKGFVADFSDLKSVQQMAQQVIAELESLDVLINNAGVYKSAVQTNTEGLDMRFVVNYLAPYVLTNQLISLLAKGTDSRIVNLSSAAQSSIAYETLAGKQAQSNQETYAQSKLALTMWSFYLAKKIPGVAVIAVNPGSLLNTKMVQEAYGKHWASADKGANILYELAVSEAHKGITDVYFDNDQGAFGKAHSDAYNDAAIERLIKVSDDRLKNLID